MALYAVPCVAPASELIATLSGVPAVVTVILSACEAVSDFGVVESVTCTVKPNVPAVVGVPEIAPVLAAKLNPVGSEPALMLQLYGDVPPVAANVALYTPPCVPLATEVVAIVRGATMWMPKFFFAF